MIQFIQSLTGSRILATILVSVMPMIELKGGIVFARGTGLDFFESLLFAYIGSTLIFTFFFFLLVPILNLLKKIKFINSFACKLENYFAKKAEQELTKNRRRELKKERDQTFFKQLVVYIFIAIPLPMTGVWAGTALAVFLGLPFKKSICPVALGNLTAGIIVSLLAELCIRVWDIMVLDYILYGLLVLAILMMVIMILKIACSKKEKD